MGLDDELRKIGDKIEEFADKAEGWAHAGKDLAKAVAAALATFGLPQAGGIALVVAGALEFTEKYCGKLKGERKLELAAGVAREAAAHQGIDVPEIGKLRELLEAGLRAAKAL